LGRRLQFLQLALWKNQIAKLANNKGEKEC